MLEVGWQKERTKYIGGLKSKTSAGKGTSKMP
jgi:hypothetical protein